MKNIFVLSILLLGILFESNRFVSGYDSPRNWVDYPYMLKFTRKTSLPGLHDQADLVCTGALVERNLVMTTSSCFQDHAHFHHFNITHSAVKSTFGFEFSNWDLIYRSFSQTQRLNRKVVATYLQPITRILFLQLEPVDSSSYYIETGDISRENPHLDGHKNGNLSVVYFNANREYHRAITLEKIRVHSVGHLSLNFDMVNKEDELPLGSLIISNLHSTKPKLMAMYTHFKDDKHLFRATKLETSVQFMDSVLSKMHQTQLFNSIIAYSFILVLLVIAAALATVWYHKNQKCKVEEIVTFKKEANRVDGSNGRSTNERNLVLELKNRLIFKGFYGRFEERNGNAPNETVI